MDAYPCQPASRARRPAARAGNARPRRRSDARVAELARFEEEEWRIEIQLTADVLSVFLRVSASSLPNLTFPQRKSPRPRAEGPPRAARTYTLRASYRT